MTTEAAPDPEPTSVYSEDDLAAAEAELAEVPADTSDPEAEDDEAVDETETTA